MDPLDEPILILSDVHLNAGADWRRTLEALRGLWEGSATVLFNGDTMSSNLSRDEGRRREVLDALGDLCRTDGVTPVLLGGNSDHFLNAPRHCFLSGGRILVLHGDVLLPNCSPWRRQAPQLGEARREALQAMTPRERHSLQGRLDASLTALREVEQHRGSSLRLGEAGLWRKLTWLGNVLTHPGRVLAVLLAWREMPHLAASFAARYAPSAQYLVVGHLHRRGIWNVNGRTIINTGSFEGPGKPLMVRLDRGVLSVRDVRRTRGRYLPGEILACYPAGAIDPAPRTGSRPEPPRQIQPRSST
jgi:UDP-2,3-diacylglucosamine pyrophosphatase LpxH